MIGTVSWSRVTLKTTGLSGGETLGLRWSRREEEQNCLDIMNVGEDISGTLLHYHIITPALYISPPSSLHLMSDAIAPARSS